MENRNKKLVIYNQFFLLLILIIILNNCNRNIWTYFLTSTWSSGTKITWIPSRGNQTYQNWNQYYVHYWLRVAIKYEMKISSIIYQRFNEIVWNIIFIRLKKVVFHEQNEWNMWNSNFHLIISVYNVIFLDNCKSEQVI